MNNIHKWNELSKKYCGLPLDLCLNNPDLPMLELDKLIQQQYYRVVHDKHDKAAINYNKDLATRLNDRDYLEYLANLNPPTKKRPKLAFVVKKFSSDQCHQDLNCYVRKHCLQQIPRINVSLDQKLKEIFNLDPKMETINLYQLHGMLPDIDSKILHSFLEKASKN